jgi:cell division protein ZapA (FtsZ GTPase activity inhibitor)
MEKNPVWVNLLGKRFAIATDRDPQYVERCIRYLERTIHSVQQSVGNSDHLRTAILSGIMLVDEIFQQRDGTGSEEDRLQEIVEALQDAIEDE